MIYTHAYLHAQTHYTDQLTHTEGKETARQTNTQTHIDHTHTYKHKHKQTDKQRLTV